MGEDARKWLDLYLECTQKQNPITFKGLVLCKWLCYQTLVNQIWCISFHIKHHIGRIMRILIFSYQLHFPGQVKKILVLRAFTFTKTDM